MDGVIPRSRKLRLVTWPSMVRWVRQFDIADRNIEAAPLVTDGVIFTVADAGYILALDAKSGDKLAVNSAIGHLPWRRHDVAAASPDRPRLRRSRRQP
jgi:hypothetical protein